MFGRSRLRERHQRRPRRAGATSRADAADELVDAHRARADVRLDRSRAHEPERSGDPQPREHLRRRGPGGPHQRRGSELERSSRQFRVDLAGAYATVLGAIYGWMYDDGPGGENSDCTGTDMSGCWGHRDNILADANTIGYPTEMDAGVGTDSGGSVDYDAIFVVNPNATAPANIVLTWAQEQPFLVGSTSAPSSISGVTLSGTPAAPTVTVTGSNFGTAAPTATPETCQEGDTGNDYGFGGLELQDVTESWGAGEAGDCIGLLLTSWSSTKVVFTFGNQYANYGPINAGDQIEATVQGATDTVAASFAAAPTVSKVSPASGPTAGGTLVTITGTNFTGATAVLFGTGVGTNLTVVSATQITVDSPVQPAGLHNVYVQTPGGTSAAHEADWFTYVAPPTVTKVSPNTGSTSGGTVVTITGTNLTGATTVLFGTGAGTNLKVVSATQITVDSPVQPAGLHNVFVKTPGGTSAAHEADWFTYVAPPTVTKVSPASGPTAGGTLVTISGTNFTGATAVLFGTGVGTNLKVVSATQITVDSPAQPAGLHNVYVKTPGGTQRGPRGRLVHLQMTGEGKAGAFSLSVTTTGCTTVAHLRGYDTSP